MVKTVKKLVIAFLISFFVLVPIFHHHIVFNSSPIFSSSSGVNFLISDFCEICFFINQINFGLISFFIFFVTFLFLKEIQLLASIFCPTVTKFQNFKRAPPIL